jgi:acyl carrier protein
MLFSAAMLGSLSPVVAGAGVLALDQVATLSYRPGFGAVFVAPGRGGEKQREPPARSAAQNRGPSMPVAFDRVADIIAETASIPRDTITPESHVIEDLGIDSLDFLDIVFALDKEYGINIPFEDWMQKVNSGEAQARDFFVMQALVDKINGLVAAKSA